MQVTKTGRNEKLKHSYQASHYEDAMLALFLCYDSNAEGLH